MNADQALEVIEKTLLKRTLNSLEQLILLHSWQGFAYQEMAKNSGYGSNYFKQVGSLLWDSLSEVLGKKVTKKNLQLVIKEYASNKETIQDILRPENVTHGSICPEIEIKYPGSPLQYDSSFYINRSTVEQLVYGEIRQPGCIIRIEAPRRMGKSSLLNRAIANAKSLGYAVVCIDFQEAEDAVFTSFNKLLRWFCANVTRQLHLMPSLEDFWDEDIGCKVSCKMYFEGYLLENIDTPIVLVFSELNQIFDYPSISKDFFAMLRFWHEMAQQVEKWQKLRLIVVNSTEFCIPQKLNQSPLNVGLVVNLPLFTLKQIQQLAKCYGLFWQGTNFANKLMEMVGGHPYLINIALYHLSRQNITLPELLETAPTQSGIYSQHLRDLLATLLLDSELALFLRRVMADSESIQLEAMVAYKLQSLGLIKLEGNLAIPSCNLYRLYFLKELNPVNLLDTKFNSFKESNYFLSTTKLV
jgi:AAA+ ATPase superfamily predicted ATPase